MYTSELAKAALAVVMRGGIRNRRAAPRWGRRGLMGFDYIPLGPLSPLRIIDDMVK